MRMRYLWPWLKNRWLEHQACKPRRLAPHDRSPGYKPVVGIADEALWRWRSGHPWY